MTRATTQNVIPFEFEHLDDPEEVPKTIGTLTAFDLPSEATPDQLAEPYLTPDGVTVLYGKGGTGKGMLASWLISRLISDGHVVMILDFEFHMREWGRRLRGLGMAEEQLRQVHWRSPSSDDWTANKGTLGQVWKMLREDCDRLGVSVLIVDSYTVATSGDDSLGGQAAAQEFFSAMSRIGRPSMVIAHVKGEAQRFPDKPFGSIFVHNFARETWAVEAIASREPDAFDDRALQPHVIDLELRNKKANGRPLAQPQFVSFSFHGNGEIAVTSQEPRVRPLATLIEEVLRKYGPMSVANVRKALKDEHQRETLDATIRNALIRKAGTFVEDATSYPAKWAVRTP